MEKMVKTKVFQTKVTYQYFSKAIGEVATLDCFVTGTKVTAAKANRLARDEVKDFNNSADRKSKRIFLKVVSIETSVTIWGMSYDEFIRHAEPIEE